MPAPRLYFTASVEEQWSALVGPWLRQQAGAAWKNRKPTVILTPSRAEGFYLRSRLVGEGAPFLGLRFWTPSDARKFLHAEIVPHVGAPTQAELRLLARVCAENLVDDPSLKNPSIASVVREPGLFLRAYDLLLSAGWDPAREGAVYGRQLAREFQQALKKNGIVTQAGLHRQLRQEASSLREPVISNLLVVGFNAAHWPLWDLLRAASAAAEQSVIAFLSPRGFAGEIDQLWQNSWEEITGLEAISPFSPIDPGPEKSDAPFADFVATYEKGERISAPGRPIDNLTLLVTSDLATHVRAVALLALDYLKRESCARLGIVFPEANALALGVAEELRRLGVPLDDGTGSFAPGIFEQRCWRTWIALQEEPGAENLIAWVRACESQGVSCGLAATMSARELANLVEKALGESLVDDLDFLSRHLEEAIGGDSAGVAADFLRRRVALPERALFAEFLDLTRRALRLPGWEKHLARLANDPPAWLLRDKEPRSRRAFLEWLNESTASQIRVRGAQGNHFYGKVHLLIYAQMTGQTWSHLILTGLNDGVWPRVFEAGAFGSRHELTELNRQARVLNEFAGGQGAQGAGHEIVAADRGHCLLPIERHDLALRDLCAALDSTSVAACLTAITTEAGHSLLPSDFFNYAYQARTGRVLDDDAFRDLASATMDWCRKHEVLLAAKILPDNGYYTREQRSLFDPVISATQVAYHARRDPAKPFGPYEFAFARPPAKPIQLSCKRWDDAMNHPAPVWLGDVVGSPPWPEGKLSWPRAVGTWVHRWLAAALRECRERNSPGDFPILLLTASDREAAVVRSRAEQASLKLYPWWNQVWNQARAVALGLGDSLAPHLLDRQYLAEFRLPSDLVIALPGM